MSDIITDSVTETGTVMLELVAKAKEAREGGESRRSFFTRTAKLAGATALGAAGVNLLQPIAARAATTSGSATNTDTPQQILNIACTAESLAITFYYLALQHPATLPSVNSTANQNYFQAALTQETEHLFYLRSLGGSTLASKFYFPTDMFTNEVTFFSVASTLEQYFISAYIAAAIDFSGMVSSNITTANPALIGAAVQIAGVECEHRALLNVAASVTPPNDRIAETALLTSVAGAVAPLQGFLSGGAGFSATPVGVPSSSQISRAAGPFGFSFFPKPTYV